MLIHAILPVTWYLVTWTLALIWEDLLLHATRVCLECVAIVSFLWETSKMQEVVLEISRCSWAQGQIIAMHYLETTRLYEQTLKRVSLVIVVSIRIMMAQVLNVSVMGTDQALHAIPYHGKLM
jgi:hypothetical protein